ncbi:TPA: hypothetical protein ACS9H9_002404 [Staphylococcus aureus]
MDENYIGKVRYRKLVSAVNDVIQNNDLGYSLRYFNTDFYQEELIEQLKDNEYGQHINESYIKPLDMMVDVNVKSLLDAESWCDLLLEQDIKDDIEAERATQDNEFLMRLMVQHGEHLNIIFDFKDELERLYLHYPKKETVEAYIDQIFELSALYEYILENHPEEILSVMEETLVERGFEKYTELPEGTYDLYIVLVGDLGDLVEKNYETIIEHDDYQYYVENHLYQMISEAQMFKIEVEIKVEPEEL